MHRAVTCWLAAGLAVLLAAAALRNRYAPAPSPLRLEARFDPGSPGRSDPLVTVGIPGAADFLYVRFTGADTAMFGYDSWNVGGPQSQPVKLAPGLVHHLLIEMPSLVPFDDQGEARPPHLRVVCDGAEVLSGAVSAHDEARDRIYLAANPCGGTCCGPALHGTLREPGGRLMRGSWRALCTWKEWLKNFAREGLWRLWPLCLVAAAAAWGAATLARTVRPAPPSRWPWWAIAAGAVCLLEFAYCLTGGTFALIFPEDFGSFYDYQALSLLHGHLDVPRVAIADEAFVFHGKYYGYFGLTPALLRVPFVALDLGFGQLSRALMLADFLACLVLAYSILRQVVRLRQGGAGAPSSWAGGFFVVAAGMGTPLLFLGSRAYVYHEAILCGAAFALAGCDCTLRYLAEPDRRWWLGALACGLLSTHARPSSGFFALAFTGIVALAHLVRRRPNFRLPFLVGLACALSVFSFNVVSYLKFRTFEALPLKYHIQYNPVRLARMGGKNFHFSNIPFNLEAYLIAPTFEFRRAFPFFFYLGRDPNFKDSATGLTHLDPAMGAYPGLQMDLAERMLGLPYAMPGLCLLALAGAGFACAPRSELRRAVALVWLAAAPFALAMMMAVATAERYTADFCPFLITAAAFGLAGLEAARGRALGRILLTLLTSWSIFATLALALHYQGDEVWGVSERTKENYRTLSHRVEQLFHLPAHDTP